MCPKDADIMENSVDLDPRRGTQIWKWYICAMEGLKIGGLLSCPLLKMGGFQNWPTREKKGIWS